MRSLRALLLRHLGRLAWWEVTCPECRRPGRRARRDEAVLLTRTHNGMQHRGRPVAATRITVSPQRDRAAASGPRSAALFGWVTR